MRIKNKALIPSVAILIIVILSCCFYYFSRVKPYNQFLSDANRAINSEKYDKAIILYDEALNYKESPEIREKRYLAELLKKSKNTYNTAKKLMDNKDYLSAIDMFKKVDKQDIKRYSTIQNKISECTKLYISSNLKSANESLTNNKFDQANTYLDNILKLDANNTDAKKLKDAIIQAIQKQKDNQAAAKAKVEENSKILTVDQAMNILKSSKFNSCTFYYTPDDNYVNADDFSNYAEIRNDYYIFSYEIGDGEADSNLCVNKKTGKIYKASPDKTFIPVN